MKLCRNSTSIIPAAAALAVVKTHAGMVDSSHGEALVEAGHGSIVHRTLTVPKGHLVADVSQLQRHLSNVVNETRVVKLEEAGSLRVSCCFFHHRRVRLQCDSQK